MDGNVDPIVRDLLANESFRAWVSGASDEDAAYWREWPGRNPERQSAFELAVLLSEGLPFRFAERAVDPQLIQQEWEKLRAKTHRSPRRQPRRVAMSVLRIAATVLAIVAFSYGVRQWISDPLIEYRTPYGSQMTVVLPDSTVVELNANSRISYREGQPRMVWLDGEAFFQVRKKPATGANFRVVTDDLTVEVLGTAFNVVEKGDQTEVVLEEGSVKLELEREFARELYMEPGELVAYSAGSDAPVTKLNVRTETITSWKRGILQFEDVPLFQVMQRIEEIYGWKATYADTSLHDRKISTPLPADDLNIALTLLSRAIGIEIERVDEENILVLR